MLLCTVPPDSPCGSKKDPSSSLAVKGSHYCKIPLRVPHEEGMQPTPVFLPGESHGQRSLVFYSPWGHQESDTPEAT